MPRRRYHRRRRRRYESDNDDNVEADPGENAATPPPMPTADAQDADDAPRRAPDSAEQPDPDSEPVRRRRRRQRDLPQDDNDDAAPAQPVQPAQESPRAREETSAVPDTTSRRRDDAPQTGSNGSSWWDQWNGPAQADSSPADPDPGRNNIDEHRNEPPAAGDDGPSWRDRWNQPEQAGSPPTEQANRPATPGGPDRGHRSEAPQAGDDGPSWWDRWNQPEQEDATPANMAERTSRDPDPEQRHGDRQADDDDGSSWWDRWNRPDQAEPADPNRDSDGVHRDEAPQASDDGPTGRDRWSRPEDNESPATDKAGAELVPDISEQRRRRDRHRPDPGDASAPGADEDAGAGAPAEPWWKSQPSNSGPLDHQGDEPSGRPRPVDQGDTADADDESRAIRRQSRRLGSNAVDVPNDDERRRGRRRRNRRPGTDADADESNDAAPDDNRGAWDSNNANEQAPERDNDDDDGDDARRRRRRDGGAPTVPSGQDTAQPADLQGADNTSGNPRRNRHQAPVDPAEDDKGPASLPDSQGRGRDDRIASDVPDDPGAATKWNWWGRPDDNDDDNGTGRPDDPSNHRSIDKPDSDPPAHQSAAAVPSQVDADDGSGARRPWFSRRTGPPGAQAGPPPDDDAVAASPAGDEQRTPSATGINDDERTDRHGSPITPPLGHVATGSRKSSQVPPNRTSDSQRPGDVTARNDDHGAPTSPSRPDANTGSHVPNRPQTPVESAGPVDPRQTPTQVPTASRRPSQVANQAGDSSLPSDDVTDRNNRHGTPITPPVAEAPQGSRRQTQASDRAPQAPDERAGKTDRHGTPITPPVAEASQGSRRQTQASDRAQAPDERAGKVDRHGTPITPPLGQVPAGSRKSSLASDRARDSRRPSDDHAGRHGTPITPALVEVPDQGVAPAEASNVSSAAAMPSDGQKGSPESRRASEQTPDGPEATSEAIKDEAGAAVGDPDAADEDAKPKKKKSWNLFGMFGDDDDAPTEAPEQSAEAGQEPPVSEAPAAVDGQGPTPEDVVPAAVEASQAIPTATESSRRATRPGRPRVAVRAPRKPRKAHPSKQTLYEDDHRTKNRACPVGGLHELEPSWASKKGLVWAVATFPVHWFVPNPFRKCIKCREVQLPEEEQAQADGNTPARKPQVPAAQS